MTLREINAFIEVLPYQQIEERAWELNIHGGKGSEYREKSIAQLEFKEDKVFEKQVKGFVEGLKNG